MKKMLILVAIATSLICNQTASAADDGVKVVRVVDDHGKPVRATLWKVAGKENTSIGATDANGIKKGKIQCTDGERLLVMPDDKEAYFYDDRTECPLQAETTVRLSERGVVTRMEKAAARAEEERNYGEAAQIYRELAERAKRFDPAAAKRYDSKHEENLKKYFNLKTPILHGGISKNEGTSDDLKKAIREFQARNGLNGNGKIDAETMQKIGGVKMDQFLGK